MDPAGEPQDPVYSQASTMTLTGRAFVLLKTTKHESIIVAVMGCSLKMQPE